MFFVCVRARAHVFALGAVTVAVGGGGDGGGGGGGGLVGQSQFAVAGCCPFAL